MAYRFMIDRKFPDMASVVTGDVVPNGRAVRNSGARIEGGCSGFKDAVRVDHVLHRAKRGGWIVNTFSEHLDTHLDVAANRNNSIDALFDERQSRYLPPQ